MAGAISAGAYTAGVIDFLLEALDAIEDVRAGRSTAYLNAGLPGQTPIVDPPHDVQIRAMSGASAGSMATAIVATILGTRVPPVTSQRSAADPSPTNNPLYDAWVQQIHYDKLLSTGDLAKKEPVLSLLNSAPLNTIVDDALNYAKSADYRRPYFADSVPIYFCISNLRGVRYSLGLAVTADVPNEYQMSMHADWMEFLWAKDAASTPGARTLSPGAASDAWGTLGKAALASGAFPIGLAAQPLMRDFADYEVRQWYDAVANSFSIFAPLDRRAQFPNGYDFVNADGGIFNNEPLELCRTALAGGAGLHNPRKPEEATRAVVLIDPFPNLFDLEIPYDVDEHRQLAKVVTSLFSAMISQARFKVEELALAKAHDVASRYAIMPVRYDAQDKVAKYAIACGALGGFGGFLSKEFRHHDFMLGGRNCQRFLATHFSLPADRKAGVENPLFAQWLDEGLRKAFEIKPLPSDPPGEPICLPIVPLLGKLASPQYTEMPPWPVKPADLRRKDLKNKIVKRADALKASFIAQYRPGCIVRAGIDVYWWLKKKKWIDEFAIKKVADDLHSRGIELS